MKIKIYKSTQRRYTEKALEIYQEKGMEGVQMYCVCSMLNLPLMYSILLEEVEDVKMEERRDELLEFYGYVIKE